jgi:hypothetical protein
VNTILLSTATPHRTIFKRSFEPIHPNLHKKNGDDVPSCAKDTNDKSKQALTRIFLIIF